MDALRARNPTKLKVNMQHVPKSEKNELTDDEKKIVIELKQLYLETLNLDVQMQRDIYKMEKAYEQKHNDIFDKRKKILDDFKKQNYGDSNPNENVPNFWLRVLKASYTEFIGRDDEKILSYLSDIRTKHLYGDTVKFVIEFTFEKNPYFKNRTLTKTYILNSAPDPEDPLSYDGAEIVKCEGCNIEWEQSLEREKLDEPSFFDFFTPPSLPEDIDGIEYGDINAILQSDFELGFYLKERVIPKAVLFFTGEIADCQSTDISDTETDESDDDSDGEEEEEDLYSTDNKESQ